MKLKAALLTLLSLYSPWIYAASTAQTTPGPWTLYSGNSLLSTHASEPACVTAARALNVTRTYTCRTSESVAVTYTPDDAPSCVVADPILNPDP